MALSSDSAEGVLPRQGDGGAQAGPQASTEPRGVDRLAAARGLVIGLASSMFLWTAALLACLL